MDKKMHINLEKADQAIEAVAREMGLDKQTVERAVTGAIAEDMANPDPRVKAFWSAVPRSGETPTPAEVLAYISASDGTGAL